MISAVYDCVVILQAMTSKTGPAAACIDLVDDSQVQLFLSPEIIDELIRVFHRPSTRKQFPRMTDEIIDEFLSKLTAASVVLRDVPAVVQIPRDPKGERYLNVTIAAQASFLVTRDQDLLDLMKNAEFRKQYPSFSIFDPKIFLDHVRGEIAAQRPSDA